MGDSRTLLDSSLVDLSHKHFCGYAAVVQITSDNDVAIKRLPVGCILWPNSGSGNILDGAPLALNYQIFATKSFRLIDELVGDTSELLQSRFEVLDHFCRKHAPTIQRL